MLSAEREASHFMREARVSGHGFIRAAKIVYDSRL